MALKKSKKISLLTKIAAVPSDLVNVKSLAEVRDSSTGKVTAPKVNTILNPKKVTVSPGGTPLSLGTAKAGPTGTLATGQPRATAIPVKTQAINKPTPTFFGGPRERATFGSLMSRTPAQVDARRAKDKVDRLTWDQKSLTARLGKDTSPFAKETRSLAQGRIDKARKSSQMADAMALPGRPPAAGPQGIAKKDLASSKALISRLGISTGGKTLQAGPEGRYALKSPTKAAPAIASSSPSRTAPATSAASPMKWVGSGYRARRNFGRKYGKTSKEYKAGMRTWWKSHVAARRAARLAKRSQRSSERPG
jgi:hypothetical protein